MDSAGLPVTWPCDWVIFFGTSPEFWLNLQPLYELRVAEANAGEIISALPTLNSPETARMP